MPKVRVQLGKSGDSPALRIIGKKKNQDFVFASGVWADFPEDDWVDVMELNVVDDKRRRILPNKLKVNLAILSAEWDLKSTNSE